MNPVMAASGADGGLASSGAVELRAVEADFGAEPVLRGVDLDVGEGEVVALLGPSGCGKTTLLRTIAGFVRPAAGTVRLAGAPVAGPGIWVPPERRQVGLVPQEGALFPHLDVAHNVAFGLTALSRGARSARVSECLELVGLADAGGRRPGELSGGQQQRVALARALAPGPAVVLLDEPFSALDATLRSQVRDDVREVLHAAGATAVLVTHDQEEALSFAQRVAVIRDGRLAQVADPVTLYRHPVDIAVAEFVGESVRLDGTLDNGRVVCVLGALEYESPSGPPSDNPLGDGDTVTIVLRPEQVVLDDPSASQRVAEVLTSTYFGHDALVRLRLVDAGAEVLARINRARLPEIGARVGISVDGAVAVFPR